jgi:hypothetical protein
VPSVFHNSPLWVEVPLALNSTVLPTTVKLPGLEAPVPALTSFNNTVPASVPSVFHNSLPWVPSSAANSTELPNVANPNDAVIAEAVPGFVSLNNTVPASVPSVFQSSLPWDPVVVPSVASNKTVPPTATKRLGSPLAAPG